MFTTLSRPPLIARIFITSFKRQAVLTKKVSLTKSSKLWATTSMFSTKSSTKWLLNGTTNFKLQEEKMLQSKCKISKLVLVHKSPLTSSMPWNASIQVLLAILSSLQAFGTQCSALTIERADAAKSSLCIWLLRAQLLSLFSTSALMSSQILRETF